MEELYDMIFKRKSFRRFNDTLNLSEEELQDINQKIKRLTPLVNETEIKFRIVPREKTTSKRGEYCLLIYSEEHSLLVCPNHCIKKPPRVDSPDGYFLQKASFVIPSKHAR